MVYFQYKPYLAAILNKFASFCISLIDQEVNPTPDVVFFVHYCNANLLTIFTLATQGQFSINIQGFDAHPIGAPI